MNNKTLWAISIFLTIFSGMIGVVLPQLLPQLGVSEEFLGSLFNGATGTAILFLFLTLFSLVSIPIQEAVSAIPKVTKVMFLLFGIALLFLIGMSLSSLL